MLWDKTDRELIKKYGFVGYGRRKQWDKEDQAWGRFAGGVLQAAASGVHVTEFLDSCPDLHRLAVDRDKK